MKKVTIIIIVAVVAVIAIWAVSWLDRVPEASILETFDKVGKSKI